MKKEMETPAIETESGKVSELIREELNENQLQPDLIIQPSQENLAITSETNTPQEEQKEQIDVIFEMEPTPEPDTNLTQLTESENELGQIQENLALMATSMAQNQSMISRAAQRWVALPWWEKAAVGAALTLPPLTIGLLAHLMFLIFLSGFAAVIYTTGSHVLHDHYLSDTFRNDNLKKESCF